MPGDATRRIVIDGTTYVWRRRHTHDRGAPAAAQCSERLTIYREGHKRYPLRIQFTESDEWLTGYPQDGVLTRIKDGATYNLNRPAVISALIRWLLAGGWNPDAPLDTDILGDGYSLLDNAGAPREPAAGITLTDASCAGNELHHLTNRPRRPACPSEGSGCSHVRAPPAAARRSRRPRG